jgi:uncharacterized protein YneF (UPF0154 family)
VVSGGQIYDLVSFNPKIGEQELKAIEVSYGKDYFNKLAEDKVVQIYYNIPD